VVLSASTSGGSLSCQLDVLPPAPKLRIQPPVVYGTQNATGQVSLNGDAPAGGLAIAIDSDNPAAIVPATVVVPAGTRSATFTIRTADVASENYAYVQVATDEVASEALVTIRSRSTLGNLSINPGSALGRTSVTGTLVLPAPATTTVSVSLSANSPAVGFPKSSVSIPKGANSVSFTIATNAVSFDTDVVVRASAASGEALAPLVVKAPRLVGLAVAPGSVLGGNNATGTLTLDSPAPDGGLVVELESSSTAASVPATATVPSGATTAAFTVSTVRPDNTTNATLTASAAGVRLSTPLTVVRLKISAVIFKAATVAGGAVVSGTVFLTDIVPAGGTTISLASEPGVVLVPAQITVAAGKALATFTAPTRKVGAPTTAAVTATVAGHPGTGMVTVLPPAVSALSLSSTAVVGGAAVTGTVRIAAAHPVDVTVNITSTNPAVATVPATVVIPAGATSATFTVTTAKPTTTSVTVTISATTGGTPKKASLKVRR
jgi:hypothetical protein